MKLAKDFKFGLKIDVANHYTGLLFTKQSLLGFFKVFTSLNKHCLEGSLSLAFLGREQHSRIHGEFLNDFRPTDVITFPPDLEEGLAGEICISVDQAIEESKKFGHSFTQELSLYLIHGWLHLIGYDDVDDFDRKIMKREEKKALELVEKHSSWPDFRLAL